MTTARLTSTLNPPADLGLLGRLHERLEARATEDAALDVHYRTVDSPIGRLLIAATEAGVARVAFEREDEEAVLQSLADRIGPRILCTPSRLEVAARWFDAYFDGVHDPFGLPLDLRLARGFRLEVLDRLRAVPYGERVSYAALAAGTSSPRAVRAVGTACATNPLPLVIPCHRVTRSDGRVGAYLGGPATKVRLLALESTGSLPS